MQFDPLVQLHNAVNGTSWGADRKTAARIQNTGARRSARLARAWPYRRNCLPTRNASDTLTKRDSSWLRPPESWRIDRERSGLTCCRCVMHEIRDVPLRNEACNTDTVLLRQRQRERREWNLIQTEASTAVVLWDSKIRNREWVHGKGVRSLWFFRMMVCRYYLETLLIN